jgi:two-component system phosphate regulon response regulator PhoB
VADRILIIDDDAAQRHLLKAQLAELGADLHEADDVPSGLAAVRSLRPHVVLLDWVMPGGSGLEVARGVSEDPALAAVRIVMLTGLEDPRDANLARQAGATAYLVKPTPADELRDVVREALTGTRRFIRQPRSARGRSGGEHLAGGR